MVYNVTLLFAVDHFPLTSWTDDFVLPNVKWSSNFFPPDPAWSQTTTGEIIILACALSQNTMLLCMKSVRKSRMKMCKNDNKNCTNILNVNRPIGFVVVFWHNESVNLNPLGFFQVRKLQNQKGRWFDPTNSFCFRSTKFPKKSNALIQIQDSSCYTQSGWSHWPSSNSRHNWFCQQMIQISRAPLDTKTTTTLLFLLFSTNSVHYSLKIYWF